MTMTPGLPERIKQLGVTVNGLPCGSLAQESQVHFRYGRDDASQPAVGLLMPPSKLLYQSNALFPVMDQNLPEGYLFQRIRECFHKQTLTPFHLLALIGDNGIGRLGFHLQHQAPDIAPAPPRPLSRSELLNTDFSPAVFDDLVQSYLSTGAGVSGMQPKILVPDRAAIPIPNLIVKAGSAAYPGLAANEFVCLSAARAAGIQVPPFDLSNDGQILILDRFDITADGSRLGFEDIASLMGLCVRDALSDRKYRGSYEDIAQVLKLIQASDHDLNRFFEQVAFTVMVRNGDGHLKNFGVCHGDGCGVKLSPMFDVVTTAIYRYARIQGGDDLEDRTLALKLFRGKGQTKTYPETLELLHFGRTVCGVDQPGEVITRIAAAMSSTLAQARTDSRVPAETLAKMADMWGHGLQYAREVEAIAMKKHRHRPAT